MTITALPTPPSRDDPATFATRADAFLGALPTFASEANALASAVNADEIASAASASAAATSATNAANSATNAANSAASASEAANVTKWVSGTTYTEGAVVWSPIDYASYRRKTTGGGTTDPSADSTNWARLLSGGATLQAIASGTLPSGAPVLVNSDGTVSVVQSNTGSAVVFESATTSYTSAVYDATNQKVVIAYTDGGNSSYGTAIVGTVSGTSISFGTAVVFESASTTNISAAYDATNQKVVIAYTDGGNSFYGTAIVGTVSGTSISFGTAVVFESADTSSISAVYDATNQKVVIAYTDGGNSYYGTAIVGTVSGTSISFGTAVVFESANTSGTASTSAVYDATNQKVVIVYRDNGNSGYGTAIVGTVSGTSISFGTAVVFESASTTNTSTAYDANSQKVVIAYRDAGNSFYGTAIVGTVSGTSISFGTAVVFESANTSSISAVYDATNQKVVIVYQDNGNSNYGTAIVGTVSGTSISFDTAVVFESSNTDTTSAVYDATNQKVVIAYRDAGNSSYGTSIVFDSTINPLSSNNFIGFASQNYTTGQTATINIISNTQSGLTLTAGRGYYILPDGTLSLTPGTPSVYAGLALSSSHLLIKG